MTIDPIQYAINRAYQFCEEQQRALDEGRITEAEWFDIHKRFFTKHYLAAEDPRAQSGHGGDEARYRQYVAPGGRLILGPFTEEREGRVTKKQVRAWGYAPSGYCEKSHQDQETLCRRLLWFDR
jgi:hypothetical protein